MSDEYAGLPFNPPTPFSDMPIEVFVEPQAVGQSKTVTEAPTNQGTLDNVLPKIPEDQLDFVTIVDQHYSEHRIMLTRTRANVDWGYSPEQYDYYIASPYVIAALKERGIEVERELARTLAEPESVEEKRARSLSPLQLVVANSLLDLTDQRSDKKKLSDLGVSTTMYQRWLRDKNFATYLNTVSESLLSDSQHEASLALRDKVKAGDLPSIKFYMEYTGRFTSKADSAGGSADRDVTGLLVRILEIVIEECDGPTAMRISDRMKETTQIFNMAAGLQAQPIIVPEVAPMRVMTDEMHQLMEKATGGDVK